MGELKWANFDAAAKKAGVSVATRNAMKKEFNRWNLAVAPIAKEARLAEMIGEEDLTIRINVKDYD